ncbi:hypothetical protein GYMLUDRAFT_151326, partial [Collybiopsis luxurians FD-317 M1]
MVRCYPLFFLSLSLSLQSEKELTYDNAQEDSGLITRYAAEGKKRKSYDGRVGNILPGNILVSSPNVNYLYKPQMKCLVHWHQGLHFGPNDPLYLPQPFNKAIPHLALIMPPCYDPQDKYYYAWAQLTEADFVPEDVCPGTVGLGRLVPQFDKGLKSLAKHVLKLVPENTKDSFVIE